MGEASGLRFSGLGGICCRFIAGNRWLLITFVLVLDFLCLIVVCYSL